MSIEVSNESGTSVDEAEFAALARYVLDELHVHPQTELSVLLVDTETMSDLHVRWMDEPGPTDVLSFPMDELRPGRPGAPTPPGLLGDVVAVPAGGGRPGQGCGAQHRRGAPAAHGARHPAPARLRPRRAGRGEGDVRPPASVACSPFSPGDDHPPIVVLVVLAGAGYVLAALLSRVRRPSRGRPAARSPRSPSPGTRRPPGSSGWSSTRSGSVPPRPSSGWWPR